jgi:hypothetical protein
MSKNTKQPTIQDSMKKTMDLDASRSTRAATRNKSPTNRGSPGKDTLPKHNPPVIKITNHLGMKMKKNWTPE